MHYGMLVTLAPFYLQHSFGPSEPREHSPECKATHGALLFVSGGLPDGDVLLWTTFDSPLQ